MGEIQNDIATNPSPSSFKQQQTRIKAFNNCPEENGFRLSQWRNGEHLGPSPTMSEIRPPNCILLGFSQALSDS
ncbi:hypothetical protein TNCV_211181 [Trichonephila clavipes]|uniref:Uncharacterized protein n=1 Tax=Trichonephila clavipes TaxID=2585209 RepID=A0A8X6SW49_TRICX|nr:hypothetical protein TNCV_211181 [Trichonephila clavipes]